MNPNTLRFSKEVRVSNTNELHHRTKLLRSIDARLREAWRNENTFEIERLQKMRTELRNASAAPRANHPKIRAAIHRSIKTKKARFKRQLKSVFQSNTALTDERRKTLETELRDLDDLETSLFHVQQRHGRAFLEYGGKPPTPDDIIHNAVIQRCLNAGKPHLILPKLAAMFPETYSKDLTHQMRVDRRVKRVTHLIKAGQIVGSYEDPIERLIAENYFQSKALSKPLCCLSRHDAVEQLETHFNKHITVDRYRRHLKSLFLHQYS
jgi:hypothetical protein